MKNSVGKTSLFGLLFLLLSLADLSAVPTFRPAAPSKYVTDYASVLKGNTAERLSEQLADFDHRTLQELIIVIYPSLPKPVSIQTYTQQLYDGWKIGVRGNQKGALLLISTQDRRGQIHVGRGLAPKLTEEVCRRIFLEKIAPKLDAGDYDGACDAAVKALIAAAS